MKKSIKPSRILWLFFQVLLIFTSISLVFPPQGVRIGQLVLHFPSITEIISPEPPEYADISIFTDSYDPGSIVSEEPDNLPAEPEVPVAEPDQGEEMANPPGTVADEGLLRGYIQTIEYSENDTALDIFFKSLHDLKDRNNLVRVLHYGDSQIENDRISSVLRNRLQVKFGGSGIGMFPLFSPVPHTAAVRINPSGRWTRYTPLERGQQRHNRYGLLLSYSLLDKDNTGRETEGSLTLRPSGIGYSRLQRMKELSVFLGFNDQPFLMEVKADGKVISSESLAPADSLVRISLTLPQDAKEYSFYISGMDPPEIYSLSIDDSQGVAVNNIPLRGSSGLEFTRTDKNIMMQMISEMNVGLIILQFGVNVVPNVVDDYSYYENSLFRQIAFLQSLCPDISIMVIGVSDMSARMPGGYYESYPNIEMIRDAQKRAAFRAGVPFWDLYEAMGGKNSMPAWVAANPPLGQRDYTHFSYRGSAIVGELLFNALMAGYENYLKRL